MLSRQRQPSVFEVLDSLPECPVCRQGDRVEKASSIVRRNSGQAFIGDSLVSYRFTNTIATDFATPAQPSAPTWGGTVARILASLAMVGLIAAIYYGATELGEVNLPRGVEIALAALALWFGVLLPIKMTAETVYRRKSAELSYPAWHEATARWEMLYYCVRDDVGFVKGSKDWRSPERVSELLFPESTAPVDAPGRTQTADTALPNT